MIEPIEKILVPDFSTDGYKLSDARAKNERGICCFQSCENELGEDTNYYMGLLACDKCYKTTMDSFQRDRDADQALWDKEIIEALSETLRRTSKCGTTDVNAESERS